MDNIAGEQGLDPTLGYLATPSFAQERLHAFEALQPGQSAYVMSYALQLHGPLDVERARAALAAIVARHDVLRSRFYMEGHQLRVFVPDEMPLDIAIVDIAPPDALSADTIGHAAVNAALQALALAPFDLTHGQLVRFRILRLSANSHVLGVAMHHAVADGQSLQLLREEFAAFYASSTAQLDELPIQYADFAEWERGTADDAPVRERATAYWAKQLAGASPVLDLPTDFRRGTITQIEGPSGVTVSRPLPDDAVMQLLRIARDRRATPAMAFLAVLALLLARWTRMEDIVIAMPVSKRSRPELAGLMGLLVDFFPLRIRTSPASSYATLLDAVRESMLGALDHAALPFERIVALTRTDQHSGGQPFQQVLFGYEAEEASTQASHRVESAATGLKIAEWPDLPEQDAKAELSFLVERRAGAWHLVIRYARPLFGARTANRLLDWFVTLCQGAAGQAEAPIGTLALAPVAQTRALLQAMNATHRKLPDGTLADLFTAQAVATPDAPAMTVFGAGATTVDYGTLNCRANQLARVLADRGVGAGENVALAMPAGLDFITAMLALVKLGAAYVPLDLSLPSSRHTAMLGNGGVRRILIAGQELPRIVAGKRQIIDIGLSHTAVAQTEANNPATPCGQDTPAYVMFTSGSTGQPKGVAIPQRAIIRLVRNTDFIQITPGDSIGFASSVSFDASTLEIWGALLNGARLLEVPRDVLFSAAELRRFISREGLTVLWLTKGLFDQLVRADPTTFHGLRVLLTGGDAASVTSFRRVLEACGETGLTLLNGYGPTENTTFSTVWQARLPLDDAAPIPIGRPIANSRAYVLDEAMQPLPPGVAGELYIAGFGLMLGYMEGENITEQPLLPDPFVPDVFPAALGTRMYRTGDLVRLTDDNTIEFLGRMDDQVKIRGFRIELGEIGAALARHPSVAASHITTDEDAETGKRLVAYVVPRPGETLAVVGLRDHLRDILPDYMIPAAFVVLRELPLNANGKIDRQALPAPDFAEGEGVGLFEPARGPNETTLAGIWSQVLRLPRVGRDDNFFHVGGDSILSIRVAARARDLGLPVTPKMLFQHQTIAAVAAALDATAGHRVAPTGPRALPLIGPQYRLARLTQSTAGPESGTVWCAGWLRPRQRIDALTVGLALEGLRQRHGALRFRLSGDEGLRVLEELDVPPPVPISVLRLRPSPGATTETAFASVLDMLAAGLDVHTGTLLRGALVEEAAGQQRVLVLVHRLVADERSVMILLEDVAATLEAEAPAPSVPQLRTWIERLNAFAQDPALAGQIALWDDAARRGSRFRAGQADPGAGTAERTATHRLSQRIAARLSPAELAARNIAGIELVLAALVAALEALVEDARAGDTVLIDVVTDGRPAGDDNFETKGLVGNLTRRIPVAVPFGATTSTERLAQAKTALRSLPDGGIGFELLNRDLGTLPSSRIVLIDDTAAGPGWTDDGQEWAILGRTLIEGSHWIAVRLQRDAGGLLLSCLVRDPGPVEPACLDPATLAQQVATWLDRLGSDGGGPVLTPSDFPLANLGPAGLQRLLAGRGSVEDIYPLSPMQESMLIHALTVTNTTVSFEQACHRIDGMLNVAAFQAAWQTALGRHPILRTSFAWDDLTRPLQIVQKALRFDFRLDDWSDLPAAEAEARRTALLAEDRLEGFRLDRPPLLRARLVRLTADAFLFLTSYHHILLDGWCLPQLEREVRVAYEAAIAGRAHMLPAPRPYAAYIAWLQQRETTESSAYFRDLLQGWPGPTPLPAPAVPASPPHAAAAPERSVLVLSEEETRQLTRFARTERITPGVLLHAGWGLVLMQMAACRDVVFGTTVSGRPAELPGVETIMGLFINNLPVRLRLEQTEAVADMLVSLQTQLLELRRHEAASPLEIEALVPGSQSGRMFDSLIVVENVPSSLLEWESSATLRFSLLNSSLRTNYALTLVGVPGDRLRLSLMFDANRFAEPAAAELLAQLRRILTAMPGQARAPVTALLQPLPTAVPRPAAEVSYTATISTERVGKRLPPRSTMEVQVTQIVEELLGMAEPGVFDDLLTYGMDSVTVSRLAARFTRAFGRTLPLTQIIARATIAELAKLLADADTAPLPWQPLVPLSRSPAGRTFYCVHPIAGDVTVFLDLAREMGAGWRFVALQAPGLGSNDPHCDSIEALAALYIDGLLRDSAGPIAIGGYSFGGVVAFEIGRQLTALGRPPASVTIIDTPAPGMEPLPDAPYTEAEWLWRMLRVRERFHSVELGLQRLDVERAGTRAGELVAARLREAGLLPETVGSDLLARMAAMSRHHYELYHQYRAASLSVPVNVIRAAELDAAEAEISVAGRFALADLGWGTVTSGPVATAVAPGNHVTMMGRPAVAALARVLDRLLAGTP